MSNAPAPTEQAAPPGPVLAGGAPAGAPKAKKLNMMVVLVGGVLLGGGGVAGYWFISKKSAASHGEDHKSDEAAEEQKKPKVRGKVVKLKPVIVNLKASKGTRYLKVSIGLEASTEDVAKELESLDVQLLDMMQEKFSTLELDKVDTAQARNGLKRELLIEINELLETGPVNKIFFSEFIIQ
jgi:flagellar protein FliL